MKFLKHSKIDLEQAFNSDQLITLKLRKKNKGKQEYPELTVRLDSLCKYLPYCYYIISKIVEYQLLLKTSWYVGLSSKHIDKVINSDNRYTALRILMALGVIDGNGHYNYKGEFGKLFPKSFKIASEYIDDIIEFEMDIKLVARKSPKSQSIIQDSVIDNHSKALDECDTLIINNKESMNPIPLYHTDTISSTTTNESKGIPLYHTDYQLRNLKNINYDSKSAYELLEMQKVKGLNDQKLNSGKNKNKHFKDYNRIKLHIDKIVRKNPSFSVGKTGRVTTTINQIDSEYRSFIKDNQGNDLMEIDFKSSHLNHLIRVIEHDLNIGNIVASIDQKLLKNEINVIKQLIENGDIYNQVCIGYASSFRKQIVRDQAKDLILKNWLNGAYEQRKKSKWIASIYPTITQYIHSINPVETVNGKSIRNRKPLSNRLLASEARLVNEIIIGRLAKEFPNSISFNVFDSILIEEDHVDHLYRIMMEESEKYFGFECQIELKENDVESKLRKKEKMKSMIKPQKKLINYDSIEDWERRLEEFKIYMSKNSPYSSTATIADEDILMNEIIGSIRTYTYDCKADIDNQDVAVVDGQSFFSHRLLR